MKTSQNLNKIINKLPKTELKQVEVRLSVMDDIEDALSRGFGMEEFVEDSIGDARVAALKASDTVRFDMTDAYMEAEALIDETEQKLKDLGADSSSFDGLKTQLGDLDSLITDLKRQVDQIGN